MVFGSNNIQSELMSVTPEAGAMLNQEENNQEENNREETNQVETNGPVRAYGDFDGPLGPVYFKPHGNMGDNASAPSGVVGKVGNCHPVDYGNRFYCTGCGMCGPGGPPHDTDDIRRNYPELVDKIRARRNNEFPFYKLS